MGIFFLFSSVFGLAYQCPPTAEVTSLQYHCFRGHNLKSLRIQGLDRNILTRFQKSN